MAAIHDAYAEAGAGLHRLNTFRAQPRIFPDRYRALTTSDLDQAARAAIDPAKLVWVVVGDASKVKSQLDTLGIPVEVIEAP